MDPRPGVYNVLEQDLAAQTFTENPAWVSTVDIEQMEAAELRRLEEKKRRRAVLHRPAHVHISFGDRKSYQQSALQGDKLYVAQRMGEASEDLESKQARMQVLNEHWLAAVFAPIPNPGETLMKEILQRLERKVEVEKEASTRRSSRAGSKESAQDGEDFEFEASELASIIHVCRDFHGLSTAPTRGTGPEVLDRAAFCRLCCAFDGFRSLGRPRLQRSVALFDRQATRVTVQRSNGTSIDVMGVRLAKDSRKAVEADAPIALLFKSLVQDMLNDQGWETGDKTRRASTKRNVWNWFFEILLPTAQEYVHARQEQQQARIRQAAPPAPPAATEPEQSEEVEPQALSEQQEAPEQPKEAAENEAEQELLSEEGEEVEDPQEKQRLQNELYAHTFVVLKGENLLCQLMEPEVLVLMPELKGIFNQLFEAYADLPMPDGSGSMSLKGLLRCCCDFDLFPDRVDYKTILWIYNSAEGCREMAVGPPPPSRAESTSPKKLKKVRSRTWSGAASDRSGSKVGTSRKSLASGKSRKSKNNAGKGNTEHCILFHGKWIKEHLAWMAKGPEAMSPAELRALAILTAAGNWMECNCLTAAELLAYFDDDGNGALSADELSIAIQFMSFENPPTKEDIEDIFSRLLPPLAVELDLETLGMAFLAVSKKEEANSGAANVMVKDLAKMSKEQSNAAIFFRELMQYMQNHGLSPPELFQKLDEEKQGTLTGRELTLQFRQLILRTGKGSPALEMENALLLLDPQGLQRFGKADFCKLLTQVRRADRVRQMSKNAHPLFLATSETAPGGTTRRVFGPVAFMECMLKIGLEHLSYHGNGTQQALPTSLKLLWLLAFLTWSFEAAKVRAAARPGTESRGPSRASERGDSRLSGGTSSRPTSCTSRTASRQQTQETLDGRPYPKFLTPLQRLLARHPRLFLDALKEPQESKGWPDWASPGDGADVLLQSCTDWVQKEREQQESYVPFDQILLKLAAGEKSPTD